MKRSHIQLLAGTLLMILLGLGCDKSAPEKTATAAHPSAAAPASETIAHLHWLGKKRLASETNAAAFMKIWNLPESARLEAQTLDKLASAPWRLLGIEDQGLKMEEGTNTTVTAAAPSSALDHSSSAQKLRPLLEDLVQEESYVELHQAGQGRGDVALAVRLPSERAAQWQTHLPAVLKALGAKRADSAKSHDDAGTGNWQLGTWNLTLARAGDWTMVTLSETNALPNATRQAMVRRIQTGGTPFAASPTNYWMDLQLNLPRVAQAFALGWNLPTNFPQASLTMIGEGENVRTRGVLDFPQPLNLELEPWNIPTNLIDGALVSFTSVRGIRPWLKSKIWNDPSLGLPPDQLFAWSLQGNLMQYYFAAPTTQASNQVRRLSDRIWAEQVAHFPNSEIIQFEKSQNSENLEWKGSPFISPFLNSIRGDGQTEFAVGGLFSRINSTTPFPEGLRGFLTGRTNLVGYDWEFTGPHSEQVLYLSQFVRMAFHKAQLSSDLASLKWLKAMVPNLRNCVTELTQTGSDQLSFSRKSSIGVTAFELQLLTDWLESPEFPRGLHTFTAKPEASQ